MKRAAGLWIDHRKAVIVFISDDGEESKEIESDMEKHTRFSGGSRSEQGGGEDQQDRQYSGHLNIYYDEVIAQLRGQCGQRQVENAGLGLVHSLGAGFATNATTILGTEGTL